MRLRHILLESVKKYAPMFSMFNVDGTGIPDWAIQRIRSIESLLHREDRVVWALRWERLIAVQQGKPLTKGLDKAQVLKKLEDDVRTANIEDNLVVYDDMLSYRFKHWLSMPIKPLHDYTFLRQTPKKIFEDCMAMEQKWVETRKQFINQSEYDDDDYDSYKEWDDEVDGYELNWRKERVRKHYGDIEQEKRQRELERKGRPEKFIDFGNGWAWWDLKRSGCDLEGGAMGHCGNTASPHVGDTVLSLRKDIGDGTVRPSLTFIRHKDGFLGEMKGRANEKPNPKYHEMILALLNDHRVHGIRGGGYEAEKNFSVLDLPYETRKKLVEQNPALVSLSDRLQLWKKRKTEKSKNHLVNGIIRDLRMHRFHYDSINFTMNPKEPYIFIQEPLSVRQFCNEYPMLEMLQNFFDNLSEIYVDDFGAQAHDAEKYATEATELFFDECFERMFPYAHGDYTLDGVEYRKWKDKYVLCMPLKNYLSPAPADGNWDNDDTRPMLERVATLYDDDGGPHWDSWSDLKYHCDDLPQIMQDIIEYCANGNSTEKKQLELAKKLWVYIVGDTHPDYFSRDPNQMEFPFYADPSKR